ncbi:GGDEF domain-containing protein [Jidongwangia harbinensis]|uniref:GGDEF domain-containing protein n=1 Tax=Jidongwangia harbinensis TaxID=2878561 RepID=UPI001CD9FB0C|nr:GGDEF domain-containing protein [Jidongwangia harbinensis]MCA2219178.1 GGDEF domain-containing protein [Jidongwangia harbinensis]
MTRSRRLLLTLAVVAVLVWTLRHWLGTAAATAGAALPWGTLLDAAAAATASMQCARAATRAGNRRARTAWICQSLACALWLLAPLTWLAGADPGAAPADAGRAGFLALAAAGFWLTFRGEDRRARLRMMLDGGVGAAATVVVAWAVLFAPLWERAGAVAVAFPLAALVLIIFYAFLAWTELRPGNRRMPGLFVLGLALVGVADLRLAELGDATGGYAVDSGGWLLGFACVATAAGTYRGTTRRQSVRSTAAWLAYAPYVPLTAAAATVAAQSAGPGPVPEPELAGMALVVLLVLLRQVLILAENRSLVARLAAREDELLHQALHCPLTGLGNRTLLTTRLQAALSTGADGTAPGMALLFCDLDDFKRVNDTMGHQAGDELLVQVADRLRTALRPQDTVVRLGGDEFAMLLLCEPDQARPLADRVWQTFQRPFEVDGHLLAQSASIGLVDVPASAALGTAADLLKAADLAMYEAKRQGKNGVRVFAPALPAPRPAPPDPVTRTGRGAPRSTGSAAR